MMNKTNEDPLQSMLQYNSHVAEEEFVNNVISNVKPKRQIRSKMMFIAVAMALLISVPLLVSVIGTSMIATQTMWYLASGLIVVMGTAIWVSSEEF